MFKRVKTGSAAFNVEYTLQVLRCKHRPLNDEERALLDGMKAIDELVPRQNPDQQYQYIQDKILGGNSEQEASDYDNAGATSDNAPAMDDDIPY